MKLQEERPTQIVLYNPKPGAGWRYAIYTEPRAVIDGRLSDLTPDARGDEAQSEMLRKLNELFGGSFRLQWQEGEPGWWTGSIKSLN